MDESNDAPDAQQRGGDDWTRCIQAVKAAQFNFNIQRIADALDELTRNRRTKAEARR